LKLFWPALALSFALWIAAGVLVRTGWPIERVYMLEWLALCATAIAALLGPLHYRSVDPR
jgi:hypothetical protein